MDKKKHPTIGDVYFDEGTAQILIFNGTDWVKREDPNTIIERQQAEIDELVDMLEQTAQCVDRYVVDCEKLDEIIAKHKDGE